MLTRRLATDLLARFADGAPPAALLGHLAFHGDLLPVDRSIPPLDDLPLVQAGVATGPGARRALVVVTPPNTSLRQTLATVAQRLHVRSPHHRWLLVAAGADGGSGGFAAWRSEGARARVSALVFTPQRPLASDAETLLALQAAMDGDDVLVHDRWCEILGREALSHRFYRALEHHVMALGEGARGSAPSEARRSAALLTTSRLLFLAFLQSRGWLDGDADFLARHLDRTLAQGGDAHRRFLEPLFFGTLNTRVSHRATAARRFGRVPFLNGGLFARSPLERHHRALRFRDEDLGGLFDDILTRYRFSPLEQQRDWSQSAIDPEMLGRAFESLMASRERRDSGSYYTPHALVVRVTDAALEQAVCSAGLVPDVRAALRDPSLLHPDERTRLGRGLADLRILDPACGSGAFLVHVLERVTRLLAAAGDARPIAELRRAVLTQSIFGVDVNPMAVWLCELRLWLSVVIDLEVSDPLEVPPLPNLDRNVRVGDTVTGGGVGLRHHERAGDGVAPLRARYARATGLRKVSLARQLDRTERRRALDDVADRLALACRERYELVQAARGRDLFGHRRGAVGGERLALAELRAQVRALRQTQRTLLRGGALPFRFASHFADVAARGGFDLVIGNPPWVRLHRIAADRREALRRDFVVFRHAAWQSGAAAAGAGAGFAAQVDLAAIFAERSVELLRVHGTLALLLPLKLWRSLAGGGVRRLLGTDHDLRLLEDWSEAPASFDAAVYPSLIVVRRLPGAASPASTPFDAATRASSPAIAGASDLGSADTVQLGVHRRELAISWRCARQALAFDDSPGAPWLILPPPARQAFERLGRAGPALSQSGLGRPLLGVKCGCNDAFLVECVEGGVTHATVTAGGRQGAVEVALLRPVLRGESARAWTHARTPERIIWTHDDAGSPLAALPPLAARWLSRWRGALTKRTDLRGRQAWWSLHRIDGASHDRARVVWADVSRGPRACVLPAHSPVVPLNSCYVISCRDDVDAAAFATLLNSPLAAAWLDALAEPARGGFRRYLGWTVARLPIPSDWARARSILAPIGKRGVAGEVVGSDELLDAAIAAYRVRVSVARALVEWTWR
ncbi:MAG: hypothetical protein IPF98_20160 [Gemmatimonadetes bacterium]|nr:hypothetical protein [Gemmatimonadota bacterium]